MTDGGGREALQIVLLDFLGGKWGEDETRQAT